MPKRSSADEQYETLLAHPFGKDAKDDERVLIAALAHKQARMVAKAAEFAGERLCYAATAPLKEAYRRFLDDAVKKDPQCMAKQAIVRALVVLDCNDSQFYLAGLGYKQLEPTWGKPVDTAADVRASCAMGLVNSGYPRALHEVVVLLNDEAMRARIGAARAIACGPPSEAELVLKLKILIGDPEAEVIGECCASLLSVAKKNGVPTVAQLLSGDDLAIVEYAAIALGESQLPEALPALREAWNAPLVSAELKRILTRGAALHRSEAAFDWLLELIAHGSMPAAEAALEALSIYKHNAQLTERIKVALGERDNDKLNATFATKWS